MDFIDGLSLNNTYTCENYRNFQCLLKQSLLRDSRCFWHRLKESTTLRFWSICEWVNNFNEHHSMSIAVVRFTPGTTWRVWARSKSTISILTGQCLWHSLLLAMDIKEFWSKYYTHDGYWLKWHLLTNLRNPFGHLVSKGSV